MAEVRIIGINHRFYNKNVCSDLDSSDLLTFLSLFHAGFFGIEFVNELLRAIYDKLSLNVACKS